MKNLKQFFVLIFLALGTTLGLAQQSISGSVSDETGPLPGVTIVEKGTTNGTTADFDGNYSISVSSEDAILVFSYLGFVTQEISANSDNFNVTMISGSDELEEVVVTGYGTQRKATITGAVAAIKGEEIVKSPAVDLTNSLSGRLPGLVCLLYTSPSPRDGLLSRMPSSA